MCNLTLDYIKPGLTPFPAQQNGLTPNSPIVIVSIIILMC